MKNKFNFGYLIVVLLLVNIFVNNTYSQIKMTPNGYLAIGHTNPSFPFHSNGWAHVFCENWKEIIFRPSVWSGSTHHAMIGTNLGRIYFYNGQGGNPFPYNILLAGGYFSPSDSTLKKDITDLTGNIDVLKQLRPKKYRYSEQVTTEKKLHFGFLAQDLQSIIPELVEPGVDNHLSMNYIEIIPFLVGAILEQQKMIDSLKNDSLTERSSSTTNDLSSTFWEAQYQVLMNELITVKEELHILQSNVLYYENNCCTSINTQANVITSDEIMLQNIPNPFQNTTTIKYSIPERYQGNFYIKIYKLSGEELKSFNVYKESKDMLFDASDLVNGMYNYALIMDDQVLKMERMIISR